MAQIPGLLCRRGKVSWWVALGSVLVWMTSGTAHAAILLDTDAVERTVVFIFYPVKYDDGQEEIFGGTGFLVDVPLKSDPSRSHWLLVTARHVIDPAWKSCKEKNPARVFLRLNVKQPKPDGIGVTRVPLDLMKDGAPTYVTGGERDDVAVLRLPTSLQVDTYDLKWTPISMFATQAEAKRLAISDSVVSAGLLPDFPGVKRNYPIFKFGQISNIPREPIAIPCRDRKSALMLDAKGVSLQREADVWLLAIPLAGGSSGSPVFSSPPGARGAGEGMTFRAQMGPGRDMLIGVQSLTLGGGVAGMTPVEVVFDVISKMSLPDADLSRGVRPARR